jgi:hypothetical protein
VGRILRKKQEGLPPLYIDIFDYPMAYKNQKRYNGYHKLFPNISENLVQYVYENEKNKEIEEHCDETQFRERFMKNM